MTTSNEISDRPQPAPGEGRWVKLGEVGVDSHTMSDDDDLRAVHRVVEPAIDKPKTKRSKRK
jgi:hypothetical protein